LFRWQRNVVTRNEETRRKSFGFGSCDTRYTLGIIRVGSLFSWFAAAAARHFLRR
ncbi:unnamed protein product, partial [Musa acuminata var. zebrina]